MRNLRVLFIAAAVVLLQRPSPSQPAPVKQPGPANESEWVTKDSAGVKVLIRYLTDTDTIVLRASLLELASMGEMAKPAVPAIVELLKHRDWGIKLEASRTLIALHAEKDTVEQTLTIALKKEKDENAISTVLEIVGGMKPNAAKALLPAVVPLLEHASWTVKREAAWALIELDLETDAGFQTLVKGLKDKDVKVRAETIKLIGTIVNPLNITIYTCWGPPIGPRPRTARPTIGQRAVPYLVEALGDASPEVRSLAATVLGKAGGESKLVVPALSEALNDAQTEVRIAAADGLWFSGAEIAPAVPALARLLDDKSELVRFAAAQCLMQADRKVYLKWSLPTLLAILRDEKSAIRHQAAVLLTHGKKEHLAFDPRLVELLKDKDSYVRETAAGALWTLGAEAAPAVPALIEALADVGNAKVRSNAAGALGAIGPAARAAVPALLERLNDHDNYVVAWAAHSLGSIGAESATVVPALIAKLDHKDQELRWHAAYGLGEMGAEAKAAIPAMLGRLKRGDGIWQEREVCVQALKKIGTQALDEEIAALIVGLRDHDKDVRRHAALSLGLLDSEGKSVAALTRMVREEDLAVGFAAARSLGCMGAKARSAVPVLIEKLRQPNGEIASEIADALRRIDPEAAAKAGLK